jgi:hypothetical protein
MGSGTTRPLDLEDYRSLHTVLNGAWNATWKRQKIMVIKRRGKLKRQKSWYMHENQIHAVNAFSYLGITLDRSGGWEKHKRSLKATGNYTSTWINKCLARTKNIEAQDFTQYLWDHMRLSIAIRGRNMGHTGGLKRSWQCPREFWKIN